MNNTGNRELTLKVSVVAGCLLKRDGKYLLVQEKKPSAYGLWNLPAGHVDIGETFEGAAIREVQEETSFTVTIGKKLAVFHNSPDKPVIHIFEADILDGELRSEENELLDAKWMYYEEILKLNEDAKLRAPWIWEVVQRDYSNQ